MEPWRGGLSGRAVSGALDSPQGQRRRVVADAAGCRCRHPPAISRSRRRHDRDQHLHGHFHRPGRLRARSVGGGDEPRLRPDRSRSGRRVQHRFATALRCRGARPHQPHRQHLARRERSRCPQHPLRRTRGRLSRGRRGAAGRRRGPGDGRNHLRHLERQGSLVRARRTVRRTGPSRAGDGLRHHHGPKRPHPLWTDTGSVLELGGPRPPPHRRTQLRAGAGGIATSCRSTLPRCHHPHKRAPECGTAERVRRLRRIARSHGPRCWRLRRSGSRQPHRRLLRHHPGAHPRPRRTHRRRGAAPSRPGKDRPVAVWPRSARRHGRQSVRQCRRTHQHDGLRALSPPHQGRRLRHGARHRPAAG